MEQIIVRYANDLPLSIKGVTARDEDLNYNIYINANHSIEIQMKALAHELRHIKYCHFGTDQSIRILEEQAQYGGNEAETPLEREFEVVG